MYRFLLTPRSEALGGGWKVVLMEGDIEAGGGVFPPGDDGYCEALEFGECWVADKSRD
jgi:hypothetical protein